MLDKTSYCSAIMLPMACRKNKLWRKKVMQFSWKCSVSSDHCTPWRWWRRWWSRSPSPSPCSCWRPGSGQGWTPWSKRNQLWRRRQSSVSSQPAPPICHVRWWFRSRNLPLRLRPSGHDAVGLGGQRESWSKMAAAQIGWKKRAGRCWLHSRKCSYSWRTKKGEEQKTEQK